MQNLAQTIERIFPLTAEDVIDPTVLAGEFRALIADLRTADSDQKIRKCQFQINCQCFDLLDVPDISGKANHIVTASYDLAVDVVRIVVDGEFPHLHIAVITRGHRVKVFESEVGMHIFGI